MSMNPQERFLFLSIHCQDPNRHVSSFFPPYSEFISLLVCTTSVSAPEHNRLWKLLLLVLDLNILIPFGLAISLLCIYLMEMCAQVQQQQNKQTNMIDALALRQNPNAT